MREELAASHDKFEKQGKVDRETWKKLGDQGRFRPKLGRFSY
jgi:hypothetical protein